MLKSRIYRREKQKLCYQKRSLFRRSC